ncbi:restriction endonuclease subunit S [uncultured Pseudoalteromonas sp.]|uniref:restriction endonuclease subunit S n=1 Tax=uncultured Pseudoalteromonas sp. TaxID=114053 RepID=UPI0030D9C295|tara:strand:+ start:10981 stop:12225 length:1245 start_codon:yes stop_codon:yes gene_type:complete
MCLNRSVPEVRFKGFSNDWNEIQLGDIATIKGRLGWKSLKQEEYVKNGPAMIAGRHIKNGAVDWKKVDHIPPWRYLESPEIMLKNDDVIFSKDGSLGNPAVVTELKREATINSTMMLVRPKKNLNANFFYQILKTKKFNDLIKEKVSGSSIPHLFQADMKLFRFVSTSLEEQTKIGNTLQNLDSLINQHQQKHDKLSNVKKAMLEKIFPKQGKTIPEIRFKGFGGEWKLKKLGGMVSFHKGKDLPKSSIKDNGVYPCIHYGELFTKYSEVIDVITSRTNQNVNFLSISNDVLMPTSDVTPKGLVKSCCVKQSGVILGGDILVIRPNDENEIDGAFLSRLIRTREQQVLQNVTGSTVFHLYASSIENLNIAFPSIEEQKTISKYFQKLDALINQHQQQITKLKNIKQACLSKMFV